MQAKIFGAGPSGSMLALALAQAGWGVTLCDPLTADQLRERSRAYALTHSSRRLLLSLDLWTSLLSHLAPFKTLRLEDHEINRHTWFEISDLSIANQAHQAVGWIVDHRPLMELLLERLESFPSVVFQLGGESDQPHQSHDLLIASDGPGSPTRNEWGIKVWKHPYRHGCLTVKVLLRGADPFVAHELFRAEGPLAVLPMGGEQFQVVWSAPFWRCQERAALPTATFLDRLAAVLPSGLEPDALVDSPAAFPLELSLAQRLQHGRGLLVGESGHRCHPVGGQGLNLCWRDVSALLTVVERLKERRGRMTLEKLPRCYARQRWLDLVLVGLATDLIVRLYSNRNLLLKSLRLPLMAMIDNQRWFRRLLLASMTDGPTRLFGSLSE